MASSEQTTKRHLNKPQPEDFVNVINDICDNMDNLDDAVPDSRKVNGHALNGDITVSKSDVGLGNVDNTSDANKPLSNADKAVTAKDYANLTFPVAAGTHCIHDNKYYVANQNIQSSESWTAAHWTQTTIGDESASLKSANDDNNSIITEEIPMQANWAIGGWSISTGSSTTNNKRIRTTSVSIKGIDYYVKAEPGVVFYAVFYNANNTFVARTDGTPFVNECYIKSVAPADAKMFRIVAKTDPESVLTDIVDATSKKIHLFQQIKGIVDGLQSAIATENNNDISWVSGGINITDGSAISSTTRIRFSSFFKIGFDLKVQVPTGMKIACAMYSNASADSFINAIDFRTEDFEIRKPNVYVRLVAAYINDSTIDISAGSSIEIKDVNVTDKSLTQSGKAADAKETGELIGRVVNAAKSTITEDLVLEQGNISSISGGNINSTKRIRTIGYYLVQFGFSLTVLSGLKAFIYYYENEDKTSMVGSSDSWITGDINVKFPIGKFIRIVIANSDDSNISPSDILTPISITRDYLFNSDLMANQGSLILPESWGIANVIESAKHIVNIKWTPVGYMPKTPIGTDYTDPTEFFTIEQHTGIPYSSVRDQDKAVGMDVSIHTFMTAVKDPNSVLYKRRSLVSNSATYYGTVCSGLVNYAMGIGLDLTNDFLASSDMFETIPMISIQPGDMIWATGHCALITGVGKDQYGRITSVRVSEEIHTLPRTSSYKSWDAFISGRSGYIARRFKNIGGVEYTAIPYVQCFDEQPTEIVYPDIQTDHGDAAVFKVGENVNIDVVNTSDYTEITVSHDGTTVYSTNTIAPFTLENVQAGLYTITANGGTNESISTFFVVDCTGSFNTETGVVTFSSTNATPVLVNVYCVPENMKVLCKPIILTNADRTAGQINVLNYMDAEYKYAKVSFLTPYGTAVWYSEIHQKWIPII